MRICICLAERRKSGIQLKRNAIHQPPGNVFERAGKYERDEFPRFSPFVGQDSIVLRSLHTRKLGIYLQDAFKFDGELFTLSLVFKSA